jgi:hypothetical protein
MTILKPLNEHEIFTAKRTIYLRRLLTFYFYFWNFQLNDFFFWLNEFFLGKFDALNLNLVKKFEKMKMFTFVLKIWGFRLAQFENKYQLVFAWHFQLYAANKLPKKKRLE